MTSKKGGWLGRNIGEEPEEQGLGGVWSLWLLWVECGCGCRSDLAGRKYASGSSIGW